MDLTSIMETAARRLRTSFFRAQQQAKMENVFLSIGLRENAILILTSLHQLVSYRERKKETDGRMNE